LRQCLYQPDGILHMDDLTATLVATVAAMTEVSPGDKPGGDEAVGAHLGRLIEALGPKVRVSVDPALVAEPAAAERLCQRPFEPLKRPKY